MRASEWNWISKVQVRKAILKKKEVFFEREKNHKPGGRVCRISQNLFFFFKEWKKWGKLTPKKRLHKTPTGGGGSAFYNFVFFTKNRF